MVYDKKAQFLVICAKRSFGYQIRVIGLQIICNDYDVQQKVSRKPEKLIVILQECKRKCLKSVL